VHGTQVLDLDAPEAMARDATIAAGAANPTDAAVASTASTAAEAATAADAAVSGRPGTVCAILTADCLPVLLAAGSGDRVGAAHAGWRGLAGGVLEAVVRAMGTPPEEMLAWLGPAIGPEHFEIGPEVRDELLSADPGAEAAFQSTPRGRFMANLFALARRRLASVGVTRVYGGGECTHAHADHYFSHRRDGVTGRQATLIWLD
jgi:YfiH family protein